MSFKSKQTYAACANVHHTHICLGELFFLLSFALCPHIHANIEQVQMHLVNLRVLDLLLKFNPFTFIVFSDLSDIRGVILNIAICVFYLMYSLFTEMNLQLIQTYVDGVTYLQGTFKLKEQILSLLPLK